MVFSSEIRNGFIQYGQSLQALKTLSSETTVGLNLMATAVSSLSPKQQALALSTRGLTTAQIAQALETNKVAQADIEQALAAVAATKAKKDLTQVSAREILIANGVNASKVDGIMRTVGLTTATEGEAIAKDQVAKSDLEAMLAQQGLSATQIQAIMTEMGLSTATLNLSNYFRGLAMSTWQSVTAITTFLATNPVGWAILAGTAIAGATIAIVEYNKHLKEMQEEAQESAETINEQAKAIRDLKDEYISILDSTDDEATKVSKLNDIKQTLIDKYGATEEALKDLNLEREKGIELLDNEIEAINRRDRNTWLRDNGYTNTQNGKAEIKNNSVIDNAIKNIEKVNKALPNLSTKQLNIDDVSEDIKSMFSRFDNIGYTVQIEVDAENAIDQYSKVGEIIDKLEVKKQSYNGLTKSELKLLSLLQDRYSSLKDTVETYGNNYTTYQSYIAQNKYEDFEDSYETQGQDTYQDFRKALLNSANGDTQLKNEFEKILKEKFPDEYSADVTVDLNLKFPTVDVSVDNSEIKTQLDTIKEQLENVFKDTDLFDKAIESLDDGKAISFDDVQPMVKIDSSLAGAFTKTADGYTIAVDKLISSRKAYIKAMEDSLNTEIAALEKSNKTSQDQIDLWQEEINRRKTVGQQTEGNKEVIKELEEAIEDELKKIAENNGYLDEYNLLLGELQETADGMTSSLSDLSDTISKTEDKMSTLATAQKEMNEDGSLSISTVSKLIDMGADYAACLIVENGQIKLNVEAYKALALAKIDNAIATAEVQGATKDEIELLKTLRDNLSDVNNFSSSGSSSSSDPIKEAYDQKREELDHLLALNEITEKQLYDTLFGSKEYQKLLSNETKYQSEIWKLKEEYYKWQNEQEDKLFDKKIDNYDKLKDKALEDNDFDNARSQVNGAISATQSRISELQSSGKVGIDDELEELYEQLESLNKELDEIDNKEIDFRTDKLDDVLDDLDEYAEKLDETFTTSDGTKLTSQEKWQAIVDVYKEAQIRIQEEIDRILDMGIEGHEEQVKQLEEQIEEYGNKISDAFKSAVEEEKDYWESVKDSVSNSYNERIDKIKEQQKAAEKAADAEIDAIQDKIDALNKVNEAKEEEINLEQLRRKAGMKTRMTYGADGTVEYKQDPEAKQEYKKALLEHQINILENQKDSLEKFKDIQSKGFDSIIEDLESQKEQDERQFDILLQRLDDYLNPNSSTSNSEVWSELAKMDGASYRNGKWIDKNGGTIDINALLKKSEQLNGNDKVNNSSDNADSDNTTEVNNFIKKLSDVTQNNSRDKFAENVEKLFGVSREKSLAAWDRCADIMPMFNPVQEMLSKTAETITNNDNRIINHNDSVANTYNIGDIVVNNPVGDSYDLAKELRLNLENAFDKQAFSNLRCF